MVTGNHLTAFSASSGQDCGWCKFQKLQRNMAGAGNAQGGNSLMAGQKSQVDPAADTDICGLFVIQALFMLKNVPQLTPTVTSSLTSCEWFHKHTRLLWGIWKNNAWDAEVLDSRHWIFWASLSHTVLNQHPQRSFVLKIIKTDYYRIYIFKKGFFPFHFWTVNVYNYAQNFVYMNKHSSTST